MIGARAGLRSIWMVAIATVSIVSGAYAGTASKPKPMPTAGVRVVDREAVEVPDDYGVDIVAQGLDFPTGVAIDDRGRPYVVEGGFPTASSPGVPRLVRIEANGQVTSIARGSANGPWTGVIFHNGAFYVAEGGQKEGGRILRITPEGQVTVVVDKLPSFGDYRTNGPVVGPDGWLYFGQGTATNSGVVGKDSADFGWLAAHPEFHDIPCRDVTLTGEIFSTPDFRPNGEGKVKTAAFSPFGSGIPKDRVVRGEIPCSGAILRVRPSGGSMELVAWGFRNPFGLAFDSTGKLFVTDNSYDDRGSRPVQGAGDLMWRVESGRWYGWPDYHGERRLAEGGHLNSLRAPKPRPLIADESTPPAPIAAFGAQSNADGFDFSTSRAFGYVGEAFVALFGDVSTATGKAFVGEKAAPEGFKVVRVDVATGVIKDFAVNRGAKSGPASTAGGRGLERPVAVRFDPSGAELYVVDFGVMTVGNRPQLRGKTGVLWRIRKPQQLAYRSGSR